MSSSDILSSLTGHQAYILVQRVAGTYDHLAAILRTEARDLLNEPDRQEVARSVLEALQSIESDEIYSRSGKTEFGYLYPGEAADELLEERMEGFLYRVDQLRDFSDQRLAQEFVIGILLGFHLCSSEGRADLLDDSPDALMEFSERIAQDWIRSLTDPKTVKSFVEEVSRVCPDFTHLHRLTGQ